MTDREIIEAIKDGRSFMITVAGPSTAGRTLANDLQRFTNLAMGELRRERDRLQHAVDRAHSALDGVARYLNDAQHHFERGEVASGMAYVASALGDLLSYADASREEQHDR